MPALGTPLRLSGQGHSQQQVACARGHPQDTVLDVCGKERRTLIMAVILGP